MTPRELTVRDHPSKRYLKKRGAEFHTFVGIDGEGINVNLGECWVCKRPKDPQPNWQLGQTAAAVGMTALARRSFRAALALDPNCPPAREGLAVLDGKATP